MSRITPQPENLARPLYPYSPVVAEGDVVVTAGQVGVDVSGDLVKGGIEAQTRQALENLRSCLRAVGCALSDVLRVNAYLASLDDFATFNSVYREFLRRALSGPYHGRRLAPWCDTRGSRRNRAYKPRRNGVDSASDEKLDVCADCRVVERLTAASERGHRRR